MIKLQKDGKTVVWTGEDLKFLKTESKWLGMTPQNWFTGMLWEAVMRSYRNEAAKKALDTKQIPSSRCKADMEMGQKQKRGKR